MVWVFATTTTVHPHACGENLNVLRMQAVKRGSPPRVWGKLAIASGNVPLSRFTPTRVGKTSTRREVIRPATVHPHACGENCCAVGLLREYCGSPPRVWGKLAPSRPYVAVVRFTPTRVGKTKSWPRRDFLRTVHPHACGENSAIKSITADGYGSPPRVWGKRYSGLAGNPAARFTPTRVGKTPGVDWQPARRAVHPHACGENLEWSRGGMGGTGSPPRVWGKLGLRMWRRGARRFTPTRVGKTLRVYW